MNPAQDTVVNVTPSTQYLNSSIINTLRCEVHLSIQVYLNPESSFSVDPILILTDLINDDLSAFLKRRFSRYVSLLEISMWLIYLFIYLSAFLKRRFSRYVKYQCGLFPKESKKPESEVQKPRVKAESTWTDPVLVTTTHPPTTTHNSNKGLGSCHD